MLGKRSVQGELYDVGNVYPLSMPASSFHAQLAKASSQLFADEDFADCYSEKMGRPSVPPSQLALVTLLQHEANVSDEEAIMRTTYDLRWAAVLRREAGTPLCAKSTLQLFRSHLIIHEKVRTVFIASIREAKRAGLLTGKTFRIAIDTKPIEGRGAVEDTFNLLATGIRQLADALAKSEKQQPKKWMSEHGLSRYTDPSIKGNADIDWSDAAARENLINGIVSDAKKLLDMVSGHGGKALKASDLLSKLLLQDIETTTTQTGESIAKIKEGTARDRIPSATDPEQRHGRKSSSKKFVGSKASIAVDIDSQIITTIDVIPGNAGDAADALELVEQSEENTGQTVEETLADCAYGGGETRQSFADAGRELLAKVPKEHNNGGLFPKSRFAIDLEADTVTCPAGHTTAEFQRFKDGRRVFTIGNACSCCTMRSECTRSSNGRTINVHPQELLLREARERQQTQEGRDHLRERVVVEHRLARLGQLGIGQARYIGIQKTLFQLMIAASVANLRRVWNWEDAKYVSAKSELLSQASLQGFVRAILGNTTRNILHMLSRFVCPIMRPRLAWRFS
jgi:hypothetical protein